MHGLLGEHVTMYINGMVLVPFSVNFFDDRVRNCVYLMFIKNTPVEVYRFNTVRFRLLFMWDELLGENEISIDQIRCTHQESLAYYYDHFYERSKVTTFHL